MVVPASEPTRASEKTKRRNFIIFAGIVLVALGCSLFGGKNPVSTTPSQAQEIIVDQSAGCEWAVRSFDTKNYAAVRAISAFIDKTMNDREQEIGGRMMKRLSKEGYAKMIATPLGLCDQHRDERLYDEALKVYDLFDGMQKSIGGE